MNKRHRINCIKLMLGVLNLPPPELNMNTFCTIGGLRSSPKELIEKFKKDKNLCGTTCCFLGTGPTLGIGKGYINSVSWGKYSIKAFGVNEGWSFLFSSHWPDSIEQCAARMMIFLDSGEPQNFTEYQERYIERYPELTSKDIKRWESELKQLRSKS